MTAGEAAKSKAFMAKGEFLKAYELAMAGLEDSPEDKHLRYFAVLALARMGATKQARQAYKNYHLDSVKEIDFEALDARIEKDIAINAPSDQKTKHFLNSAERYNSVFKAHGSNDYYPAINAASMFYLAGYHNKAKELGEKTLELLGASQDDYWSLATAAEANLLSGNLPECTKLLEKAVQDKGATPANTASTRRQFKLLSDDPSVLAPLTLPTIIHFAGHIIREEGRFPASCEGFVEQLIADKLEELNVMIGYGSLASGADILFAEQILARGGELHVILPFDKSEFLEVSVVGSGPDWVSRFEYCFENASSHTYSSAGPYNGNDALFNHCSVYAMGRACLRQQHLDAPITQIVVWDGETTTHTAGTFSDQAIWTSLGYQTHVIPISDSQENINVEIPADTSNNQQTASFENQSKSIVFGDVAGFSKLTDAQIPVFVTQVMGELAKALESSLGKEPKTLLSVNTWGDGLFIVFSDVVSAAKCAVAMQEAMAGLELSEQGFTEKPQLRLGAHFGPIFEFEDPLTKRLNYFGQHVNTAARIEPIAPQGEVYVTEAFAAHLALNKSSEFEADYVGKMELAKRYGKARMYLLRM